MSTTPRMSIDVSGPFFQRSPGLTLLQNVQRMMTGLAQEIAAAVSAVYPVASGAGRDGVVGRVESLSGKKWMAAAVVSQSHVYPWPRGGAKEYRGGKTEARYHMFRNAARAVRAVKADLAAGLE